MTGQNISTMPEPDFCENIRELLEVRALATPDRPFLFSEADGREYSYKEFDRAVNRTARLLLSHGIKKGDVVSLLLPNSAEYLIAYFACFKLGALAGPVNSLLKPQEMAYVIAHSEARALLVQTQFLPQIEEVRVELPALDVVIEFDDERRATREFAHEFHSDDALATTAITKDDVAFIIYTSGTTGKPKGCLLTHGNLLANARQITSWLNFTERDRLLIVMPLFHVNAVMVTTLAPLYAHGSTVVTPKFSVKRFWQIVSDIP